MNTEKIFAFIKSLAAHNDREWFAAHKEEYQEVKALFEQMVQDAILRIATFDKSIEHVQVKDCTYRIYRDTRFSDDKSPYKRHMGAYINAKGKKSLHGGYYIHLEPGNCMIAGGNYWYPPKLMAKIRESIMDNIDEYKGIVDAPAFKQYFPVIGEEQLVGAPRGYKKNDPNLKYIQPKQWDVAYYVPDSFFCQPDWLDNMEAAYREMKPFLDFINYTVDEFQEDEY